MYNAHDVAEVLQTTGLLAFRSVVPGLREKGSDENWPDSVVGAVLHQAAPNKSDGG